MHAKRIAFAMPPASAAWAIVSSLLLCAAALEDMALGQCCAAASDPSLVAEPGSRAAPMRMAFIIGAMKAGTTFLYDELVTRHPAILARTVNEETQHMVSGKAGAPCSELLAFMSYRLMRQSLTLVDHS